MRSGVVSVRKSKSNTYLIWFIAEDIRWSLTSIYNTSTSDLCKVVSTTHTHTYLL